MQRSYRLEFHYLPSIINEIDIVHHIINLFNPYRLSSTDASVEKELVLVIPSRL